MKNFYHLLCLLLITLTSCQSSEAELGLAERYLPSTDLLLQGVVNKYYLHNQEKDKEGIHI